MIRTLALITALYAPVALAQPSDIPTVFVRPDGTTLDHSLALRGVKAMDSYDDISAARLLLKPAADAGDADAARRIADTFDAVWLVKHHVIGVEGLANFDEAMFWYRRAAELGDLTPGNRYLEAQSK